MKEYVGNMKEYEEDQLFRSIWALGLGKIPSLPPSLNEVRVTHSIKPKFPGPNTKYRSLLSQKCRSNQPRYQVMC